MINLIDNTPVHVQAVRRALCVPLPRHKLATLDEALVDTLARKLETALGVQAVTPRFKMLAPQQWSMNFYYGRDKYKHVPTYEKGEMGEVKYIPQQMILIVLDICNKMLYLSMDSDETKYELPVLNTLNGTLFPTRAPNQAWSSYRFNLANLATLDEADRKPEEDTRAWQRLSLRTLAWREAGCGIGTTRRQWVLDGFDALAEGEFKWPKYLQSAGLKFQPQACSDTYGVEFMHDTGYFRASLTAVKLNALAALVKLLSFADYAPVETK
jgi:hypothetical protein